MNVKAVIHHIIHSSFKIPSRTLDQKNTNLSANSSSSNQAAHHLTLATKERDDEVERIFTCADRKLLQERRILARHQRQGWPGASSSSRRHARTQVAACAQRPSNQRECYTVATVDDARHPLAHSLISLVSQPNAVTAKPRARLNRMCALPKTVALPYSTGTRQSLKNTQQRIYRV